MSSVAPTTITGSVVAQKTLQSLLDPIIKALNTPTSNSEAKKKAWYRHFLAEHSLIRAIAMLMIPAIWTTTETQTMTAAWSNHSMEALAGFILKG